jgi:hypothetical protein
MAAAAPKKTEKAKTAPPTNGVQKASKKAAASTPAQARDPIRFQSITVRQENGRTFLRFSKLPPPKEALGGDLAALLDKVHIDPDQVLATEMDILATEMDNMCADFANETELDTSPESST